VDGQNLALRKMEGTISIIIELTYKYIYIYIYIYISQVAQTGVAQCGRQNHFEEGTPEWGTFQNRHSSEGLGPASGEPASQAAKLGPPSGEPEGGKPNNPNSLPADQQGETPNTPNKTHRPNEKHRHNRRKGNNTPS